MEQTIVRKLREIEKNERIHILLAVESGSRAWVFPSTDSDYDVRFIYIRQKEDYLRLEKTRDVIELPLDGILDINGWDLQKTLRLFHKSNPTLFEWFSSPIVYMETPFADTFRTMMGNYFSTKRSLYHYIHMAEKNRREYLNDHMTTKSILKQEKSFLMTMTQKIMHLKNHLQETAVPLQKQKPKKLR